jgi:hypothetical protein
MLAIMAQPLVVEQSRAMPLVPKTVYDGVLEMDVPTVFRRWFGPFPPIKQVVGDLRVVGDARTLKFAGGGSAREELVHADSPSSYARQSLEELSLQLAK